MRRKIVAGNWKMNKSFQEAEDLLNEIGERLENSPVKGVDVVVCPPAPYLELAKDLARESSDSFSVGAQDVSQYEKGAYTGEIAANMLQSMEVEYCIVGHSERRKYHAETNAQIAQKVEQLLANDLVPIVCCGEVLEERESNQYLKVIEQQISESLFALQPLDFAKIIVAYEPVWAIGTGKTASPAQAQEIHAYIRQLVLDKYGKEIAKKLPILYGGSCNAKNAEELFAQEDVDGVLIGGASLVADDFATIVNSFK
ncbi:MAG: triose-phosphate isomerase [Bacteroidales bacterium]